MNIIASIPDNPPNNNTKWNVSVPLYERLYTKDRIMFPHTTTMRLNVHIPRKTIKYPTSPYVKISIYGPLCYHYIYCWLDKYPKTFGRDKDG